MYQLSYSFLRYLDVNQADMSMQCGYGTLPIVQAISDQVGAYLISVRNTYILFLHTVIFSFSTAVVQAAKGTHFLLPTEDSIVVSEILAERFEFPYWQYTLAASSANKEILR